ncbi:MAG: hypothetical protein R6V21_08565 [Pelovirga sp.]
MTETKKGRLEIPARQENSFLSGIKKCGHHRHGKDVRDLFSGAPAAIKKELIG